MFIFFFNNFVIRYIIFIHGFPHYVPTKSALFFSFFLNPFIYFQQATIFLMLLNIYQKIFCNLFLIVFLVYCVIILSIIF